MKVVHVTQSPRGGAGIAAMRLHLSLLKRGVDSSLLACNMDASQNPGCVEHPGLSFTMLERLMIKTFAYRRTQKNNKMLQSAVGNTERLNYDYSFPWTDERIEQNAIVESADIINLHLVSGMINFPTFFTHVNQPIVWTLHDLNPTQGGFHYSLPLDLPRRLTILDERIREEKAKLYAKSQISGIVGPSNWITQESASSKLLGMYPHRQIPNSVPSEFYNLQSKNEARIALGLPMDKTVILFVSATIDDPRKGFDLLLQALKEIPSDANVHLAAIGKPPNISIEGMSELGLIQNDRDMAQAYAAADAFIIPSREDNLPNVILEALCCGTPCLATPVGGVPELIEDGVNGYLAEDTSPRALCTTIHRFLNGNCLCDRSEISSAAIEEYGHSKQADSYMEFYGEILTR